MKRYFDLAESEKLNLSNDDLQTAVRLEAVELGIKPPITLPQILEQVHYQGFSLPGDNVIFYEVIYKGSYSTQHTGLCFKTPEEARRACEGAIIIEEDGYPKSNKIKGNDLSVAEIYVSLTPTTQFSSKIEEFTENNDDFNKLCDECMEDLSEIRQRNYNKVVLATKRAEYLRLAGGNEEIAKAFWAKTEGGEFPAAE